jgi:hypothetical protein
MAVLKDGQWLSFEMDLGNPEHRAAFPAGLGFESPMIDVDRSIHFREFAFVSVPM